MTPVERDEAIAFIVSLEFPTIAPDDAVAPGGTSTEADTSEAAHYVEAAAKLVAELRQLDDTSLSKRLGIVRIASALLRKNATDTRSQIERIDAHYPPADIAHWAKCVHWRIDEAIALILGRAPEQAKWSNVSFHKSVLPMAQQFGRIRDLALRAIAWNQLSDPVAPGAFIAWAKRYHLPVPTALEAEIIKYGHNVGDWKTAYDKATEVIQTQSESVSLLKAEIQSRDGTIAVQKAELARLSEMSMVAATPRDCASPDPPKPAEMRQINSLHKMVIAMAIKGYVYDPNALWSKTSTEIVTDIELLGLSLDVDTVRDHLKRAAKLLPQQDAPKLSKSTRKK